MGFGWLLVGYFFVSVISLYSTLSFAMLAGYPMMIFGLWQLAPYHRYFRAAFFFSFLSLPFAVYYALYGLGALGISLPIVGWLATVEWVYFAFNALFSLLWLGAITALCRELRHEKLLSAAVRSLGIFTITCVLDLISRLPVELIRQNSGYLILPVLLGRLLLIFLNLYLIYSCYRYICPEGQEFNHLQADAEIAKMKKIAKEKKGE